MSCYKTSDVLMAYLRWCKWQYIIFRSGILENNSFNIALFAKYISRYTDIPYGPKGVYHEI